MDTVSIGLFGGQWRDNLYRLWNRMSSGTISRVRCGAFVVVTHPFHPLTGLRLEVLFVKKRGPAAVFVCSGGFSGQITLPESWTDRGELPLAGRLSAEGLAVLGTLARAALRAKEWHEAVAGLVADFPTTPRGAPRNVLQLGATFWHFRRESRVTLREGSDMCGAHAA